MAAAPAALPAEADMQFVGGIPPDLQCGICASAVRDAMVTEECGHLFCKSCVTEALTANEECPSCHTPLTLKQVRKDVRSQRKVASMEVFCQNKKLGCSWKGCLSDLPRHTEKCEFASVKCPFAAHGCDAVVARKTLQDHVQTNATAHLLHLCSALTKAQEETLALQQTVDLLNRDDEIFIWSIPSFNQKKGPVYSRKFAAKGVLWYLGVDFEGPDQYAGVYLFAEGHNNRVTFKLTLFNIDPARNKVHSVDDWSVDFKGKGWGPLKFINRSGVDRGFMVNGCVRIGVELEGDPFD